MRSATPSTRIPYYHSAPMLTSVKMRLPRVFAPRRPIGADDPVSAADQAALNRPSYHATTVDVVPIVDGHDTGPRFQQVADRMLGR